MKESVRSNDMTVEPAYYSGWNMSLAQLFGSGPKWTITCGACHVTFKKRLPMVSRPGVACPSCGAVNVIPVMAGSGVTG